MDSKYTNKYLKNKWPSHKIEINDNSENELKKKSQQFIDFLEKDYQNFIKLKDIKLKNIGSTLDYDFEFKFKNSPLTIFDAAWGQGKTYFFESLIHFYLENKIKLKIFKKIIIVDAWKYSYISDSIPNAVISEILYKLADNNKELRAKLFDFGATIFNVFARPWLRKFNIEVEKYKKKTPEERLNKKIESKDIEIDKTIIIIDNIERLGDYSWEILKAIFHLSNLNNLIFILPMNKDRMIGNNHIDSDLEFPIEKFIDIEYYTFSQNYLGILKQNLSDETNYVLDVLNKMLKKEIEGKKLSIREAEKNILSIKSKIETKNNDYSKFKYFAEKIWMDFETIKFEIKSDFYDFLENKNNINKLNLLIEKDSKFEIIKDLFDKQNTNKQDKLSNKHDDSIYEFIELILDSIE